MRRFPCRTGVYTACRDRSDGVVPSLDVNRWLVVAGATVFLQDDERVTWRLPGAAMVAVLGITLALRA